MKIIFLCGSLEVGKDGVGDYTRRLAKELIMQGHIITTISLMDNSVTEVFSCLEVNNLLDFSVLRIPSSLNSKSRFNIVRNFITSFKPDLLSLQFVPFSFHDKGLSISLNKHLKSIGRGVPWHIMFHELWVGMGSNDSLKRRFWGRLQKILIKDLIAKLKPVSIHTQCDLYAGQLLKENIKVKKLPLFSNIEVFNSDKVLQSNIEHLTGDDNTVKFVFFGGLHPDAKLKELVSELRNYQNGHQMQFSFLYIGRNGSELNKHKSILNSENVDFTVAGELEPQHISYLLSVSSYGVATGSPEVLEKNGTVSAMIDHKVPVICIGKDLRIDKRIKLGQQKGIYFIKDLDQILTTRPSIVPAYNISDVVTKFINDVSNSFIPKVMLPVPESGLQNNI